jgi:hypothetical protein
MIGWWGYVTGLFPASGQMHLLLLFGSSTVPGTRYGFIFLRLAKIFISGILATVAT